MAGRCGTRAGALLCDLKQPPGGAAVWPPEPLLACVNSEAFAAWVCQPDQPGLPRTCLGSKRNASTLESVLRVLTCSLANGYSKRPANPPNPIEAARGASG